MYMALIGVERRSSRHITLRKLYSYSWHLSAFAETRHHSPRAGRWDSDTFLIVSELTGAGDTAIAAFAVAVERGHTFPEAAWYANKAAGVVVQKFGTSVATEAEVFGDGLSQ